MLGLRSKTKIPAATALTAEEWHKHKARKTGAYQVIGGAEGQAHHSLPVDFATAWEIFSRAVKHAGCTPESGSRIKLVPASQDATKRAVASALLES